MCTPQNGRDILIMNFSSPFNCSTQNTSFISLLFFAAAAVCVCVCFFVFAMQTATVAAALSISERAMIVIMSINLIYLKIINIADTKIVQYGYMVWPMCVCVCIGNHSNRQTVKTKLISHTKYRNSRLATFKSNCVYAVYVEEEKKITEKVTSMYVCVYIYTFSAFHIVWFMCQSNMGQQKRERKKKKSYWELLSIFYYWYHYLFIHNRISYT